ncbi:MAG: hypothetical protein IT200_16440 [Thermoleophilia bacterium]|nr:hypothetical protein [Thermoleophilia bacterium]
MPPLPREAVERPRLRRDLAALAGRHPVIAVVAAPGAGKTTAVTQHVTGTGRPAAWLTLDPGDRRPGRFAAYLAAAVAAVDRAAGEEGRAVLADGPAPAECAAVLGERMSPGTTVVLDDVHELDGGEAETSVLRAFVRGAAPHATVFLLSRRLPALGLERDALASRLGGVFDDALAFTVEETRALLRARGSTADAGRLQAATGGWAAGLVFDATAAPGSRPLLPPGEDPLFAYLGAELFDRLGPGPREALLRASVLDVVTPARLGQLLGDPSGDRIFEELCRAHLPATVEPGALRFHPRFREFLQHRLRADAPGELEGLSARFGMILAGDGYTEEAVDALLAGRRHALAADLAERATPAVIRRGDWDKVIAWSEALGDEVLRTRGALRAAQLRALLLGRRQREVEDLVHAMLASGELGDLAGTTPDAVGWAVWALHASGEWAKLLPWLPPGAEGRPAVVRHLFQVTASPVAPPELPPEMLDRTHPLHVALQSALFYQGRFEAVERLARAAVTRGPVTAALGQIFRIAVLHRRGELDQARRTLEAVAPRVRATRYMEFWHQVEAELAFDEGDADRALHLAAEARRLSRSHGYRIGDRALFAVTEGRLLVQMGRGREAEGVLADASAWCRERGLLGFREWADAWLGAARLLLDRPVEDVTAPLRAAVGGMRRATRYLELPLAAVALAEAEWRRGDEAAHDAACDVALEAARAMGSLAPLRRAVALFPDVLARRADAAADADDPWRRLQRAVAPLPAAARDDDGRVMVRTLGEWSIEVDGVPVRVGLGKAVELAAYLAAVGPAGAARERIVAELFSGSDDGPNYLRQAVHRLRRALPEGVRLVSAGGRLRWDPPGAVRTDDQELAALLARARLRLGDGRVQALRDAVAMCAGPYLPGLSGSATDARRREVAALDAEARSELARCLLEAGRPAEAAAAARDLLARDPLAEDAWQLLMRAEAAIGGPGAVGPLLRECRAALAAAGLEPCTATVRVADRLRRSGARPG